MAEYKHEGQAEWDGRQAYMQRLHNVIMQCHISNFNNSYLEWYKSLMVLKIELSAHFRTAEEKENVKKAMSRLKSCLYDQQGSLAKFEGFIAAQETLHSIMRARGFDVPINDQSPGKSTR